MKTRKSLLKSFPVNIIYFFILLSVNSTISQVKFNSNIFGDINARHIGPAVMSGRITAIDGVNMEPTIIYVGTAAGGVYKTMNGGASFKPVFDKYTQSIGAITIDQAKPDIVWVGTGECNVRNSVSVGTGIYKTIDAGETWQLMGLEKSERISKIVINPTDGNTVYASVPGALWGDSEDRGLYKTVDGGKSWEKILYVNEKTGCADVAIDPKNPDMIYASMWEFRRTPYSFSSGGQGSGLYKSIDGGKSWNRIDKAFSEDELGRICIAVCPSEPNNIYAIAESKKTSLFRSTDYGESWKKNSSTFNVTARPFYFSTILVDPTDPNRVYRPAFSLSISKDGGESFVEGSGENGWVHSDHHALWINPKNPSQLYLGTDGGVYLSVNRGYDWIFLANLPVSQFYHITTDNQHPYNVYGGLQDNGSWKGPSSSPGGIKNKDWRGVGGGDGFAVVCDGTDNDIVYSESQGGNINRINIKTGETKDIQPQQGKDEPKLRFNWNTPIVQSSITPGIIYTGSQFLYKTNNKGDKWEKISPDLTTNDPNKLKQEESGGLSIDNSSAENHCTIYSIAESYLSENILWVGTDDGNLQLTKDGGRNWSNVVNNIPGLPKNTWCSSIEPSHFNINTAYATFDGHRSGDKNVYVYKTTDAGKSWKPIMTDDIKGYAQIIREDLVNNNLLFTGTEFGLYISIDGGKSWAQFKNNLSNVPVMDIEIQKDANDLVLATHGRGVVIIDDITPLRKISSSILESEFSFLPSRTYFIDGYESRAGESFPPPAGEFSGANAPEELPIIYYLKDRVVTEEIKLEVHDANGKLLISILASNRKGINIVRWNKRLKPPKVATGSKFEFSGFTGPLINEGEYIFKLIKGDKFWTQKINLSFNPKAPYSKDDREAQHTYSMKLYNMQEELAGISDKLRARYDSLQIKINSSKDENETATLKKKSLEIDSLIKTLSSTKEGLLTGELKLRENIGLVYSGIVSYPGRPTDSQISRTKGLEYELEMVKKKSEKLLYR